MIYHTEECLSLQAKIQLDRELWWAQYPDACPRCEGAGGFRTWATRDEPEDYNDCICREAGKCARCGYLLPEEQVADADGDPHCLACGWKYGSGFNDVCPGPFDGCDCEDPSLPDPSVYPDGYELDDESNNDVWGNDEGIGFTR